MNKTEQINWMKSLLSIVAAIALSLVYIFLREKNYSSNFIDLLLQVIPDLIAVLIAFPVVYFIFIRRGISSYADMKEDIILAVSKKIIGGKVFQSQNDVYFDLKKLLLNAKDVLILGYSCKNLIISHRAEISQAILNGANVKIITIKPKSTASTLMMEHQRFGDIEPDLIDMRRRFFGIQEEIEQSQSKKKGKGNIEIKTINWIPSCSLILINSEKLDGVLKLKVYAPFVDTHLSKIQTHTVIRRIDEKELFDYFVKQFELLWEQGNEEGN